MTITKRELKNLKLKNVQSIYSENYQEIEDKYLKNLDGFNFEDLVHWEGPKNTYLKEKGFFYVEKEGRGGPQHGKLYCKLELLNNPLRVELIRIQNRDSTIRGKKTVLDTVFYIQ